MSHATYDKWVARILCEKIEELGATTFRDDRDIAGGNAIPPTIRQEIRRADEVLVLLSPESVKRPWVFLEIGMAFMIGKRIVPLMFHLPADQLPDIMHDVRGFHLESLDDYLADLKRRISAHAR